MANYEQSIAESIAAADESHFSPDYLTLSDEITNMEDGYVIGWDKLIPDSIALTEGYVIGWNKLTQDSFAIEDGYTVGWDKTIYDSMSNMEDGYVIGWNKSVDDSVTAAEAFLNPSGGFAWGGTFEDRLLVYGFIYWAWGATIADSIDVTDAVEAHMGILIREYLSVTDSGSMGAKQSLIIAEAFALTDSLRFAWGAGCGESLSMTDSSLAAVAILVLDYINIADNLGVSGKYNHTISESIALSDLSKLVYELVAAETLTLADTQDILWQAMCAVDEMLAISEASTPAIHTDHSIEDGLSLGETTALTMIYGFVVADSIGLITEVLLDGEIYICFVLNTNQFHASVYSNYAFNSFCTYKGVAYGCKSDGIFSLSGTTDDGSEIKSGIVFPETHFGMSNPKRIRKAYLGITGDSPSLFTEVEDGTTVTYSISTYDKINGRRDVKGRRWTLKVQDFDNIEFIKIVPVVLSKKRG